MMSLKRLCLSLTVLAFVGSTQHAPARRWSWPWWCPSLLGCSKYLGWELGKQTPVCLECWLRAICSWQHLHCEPESTNGWTDRRMKLCTDRVRGDRYEEHSVHITRKLWHPLSDYLTDWLMECESMAYSQRQMGSALLSASPTPAPPTSRKVPGKMRSTGGWKSCARVFTFFWSPSPW